ncbi:MAG: hypothetical protein ACK54O_14045, partial [Pseudanabaena sp.]
VLNLIKKQIFYFFSALYCGGTKLSVWFLIKLSYLLARFKEAFPKYKNYNVYGAIAVIKIDEKADEYATQEGLFLIEPAGDSVIIANSQNLQPRVW